MDRERSLEAPLDPGRLAPSTRVLCNTYKYIKIAISVMYMSNIFVQKINERLETGQRMRPAKTRIF